MKIFGIGLSKTGTTSLAQALTILGYRTKDYPGLSHYAPGDLSSINAGLLDEFDALTDTPIPSFYRELDVTYPDAKFILTVRDAEGWLKSCKKQFTEKLAEKQNEAHNRLFMDLYSCTVFDEEKFLAGYNQFVQAVRDHFKDRPGKLLTMDVVAGDGWEKLCPFLDKPVPEAPFPKANVTRIRWMKIDDLVDTAKAAGDALVRTHRLMLANDAHRNEGGSWPKSLIKRFGKAYLQLRGGRDYAMARAATAANAILVQRLSKLNPDIPIVSRLSDIPAHQERGKWNHFWLIDPLDGTDGFANPAGGFSVNIALVEDQKPIYGVVHAPSSNTTYYAVAGKGGFKIGRDEQVTSLDDMRTAPSDVLDAMPASKAMRICLLAEGVPGIESKIGHAMEWHSAAAQVIAQACGKQVLECDREIDLRYNKADFEHHCITVK